MMDRKTLTGSVLIHPDELDSAWITEALRLHIPRIGLHPVGGKNADQSMRELLERLETPAFRAVLDEAAERGVEIEYEMHAARYLLPTEEFEKHPDWFRMNAKGERAADYNCCPSNPEALSYMAKRAGAAAKRFYRSTKRFFLWMDDAVDSACHCPACQALTPSDQQMLVMNALLAGIREEIPDARLAYLAYADCKEPPKHVRPADGIFLEYAPMDRDFHIPMNDPSSEKNARQCAYPEALLDFFGRDDAKLLEYWLDNSMFSGWVKPPKRFAPDAPVIAADAAYYRSLGFTDLSTFACFLGYDYREQFGMPDITPFAAVLAGDGEN